jgi:phage protein D
VAKAANPNTTVSPAHGNVQGTGGGFGYKNVGLGSKDNPYGQFIDGNSFSSLTAGTRYDFIAPRYLILVNDTKLQDDIAARIRDIHVDFDVDKATEIKISAHDHDGKLRDYKYLAPGSLIHVWVGYGAALEYLASGEIVKWTPGYPKDGPPTIEVCAYDGSHANMDRQGHKDGSTMKSVRDSKVVTHKITEHMGHIADVDETDKIISRLQRKGISDYQFVKRLALLNDFYYWCDFDIKNKKWVGHFRDKRSLRKQQEAMYSFIYGMDNAVSLIDFKLDFTMRGMSTDIEVVSWDNDLKKPINAVIKETEGIYTDHAGGRGGANPSERQKKQRKASIFVHKQNNENTYQALGQYLHQNTLMEDSSFTDLEKFPAPAKGTMLTFTCFGQRIFVVADKPFKNQKDAAGWATRFMKARLENFIHGNGTVVGTPNLRPRQIHYLGTGDHFGGRWEFTKVTHKILTNGPYEVDFEARRMYEPTDPKANQAKDVPVVPRYLMKGDR